MRPVIGTLFFTCAVIFNLIQLSSQSGSPRHYYSENERFEDDFANLRLDSINTGKLYHGPLKIHEGHIETPRSSSFQRRLNAYQEELTRGGQASPVNYVPRPPNNPRRTTEEIYSVPHAADGVFHNVHNRPAEVIDNYLDSKPRSENQQHGSGSGSKSKGKSWYKSGKQ